MYHTLIAVLLMLDVLPVLSDRTEEDQYFTTMTKVHIN